MSTLSVLSRRAYGGRKDQRNVLRSRFPYKKCVFMLRPRGSGIRCRAFVECGRAFPRQPVPMLSPCPRGTIICLRRGRGCVSHQVTYPPGCCRAAHPACGAQRRSRPTPSRRSPSCSARRSTARRSSPSPAANALMLSPTRARGVPFGSFYCGWLVLCPPSLF